MMQTCMLIPYGSRHTFPSEPIMNLLWVPRWYLYYNTSQGIHISMYKFVQVCFICLSGLAELKTVRDAQRYKETNRVMPFDAGMQCLMVKASTILIL